MKAEIIPLPQGERIIYFDALRIIAIIGVIFLHLSAHNWTTIPIGSGAWTTVNFYNSLCRWCVPVFVMISGALFLGREEIPLKKLYGKYILRLFAAYIIWSFVYYLFSGDSVAAQFTALFRSGKILCLEQIIRSHYHLWFVPMMIGLYICLPVLKQIVKNPKISRYFLAISFVFWFFLPQIYQLILHFGSTNLIFLTNALNSDINDMMLQFVLNFGFYFILGYELARIRFDRAARRLIYLLGIVGWLFTFGFNVWVSVRTQTPIVNYFEVYRINVLMEAIAVFELLKNFPFKGKASRVIRRLSDWSFGAYLVHALMIELFYKYDFITLSLPTVIAIPATAVAVAVCAFGISGVLHCIPILKKYVV